MRAIRYERYGTPDVLAVREADVPVPVEDEVLVRVRAAAVNATNLRYDLLIDMAGSRTVAEYRRVLTPRGVLVAVGGPVRGKWVKPLLGPLSLMVSSLFTGQTPAPFLTRNRRADLIELAKLMESGQVTPVIGRTCTLEEAPEAIGYVGADHASGKVIIDMGA